MIEALEAGTVPWRKPWATLEGAPRNLQSGKCYRGVNIFLLAFQGYSSPYWLTRKQIFARGGKIRKGEHGTAIVFWKTFDSKTQVDKNGKPKKCWMLRYYLVWNVEQTEGVDYPKPEKKQHNPIPVCESVVENWEDKPSIVNGGRACYSRRDDRVTMPELGYFDMPEEYYSTLFHELAHSTGHESRLNRDLNGGFGSRTYSLEELVAEMGAAFLCGFCGIECKTLENSAAYIQTWLGRLKADPKLVISAASRAQKAADMILGSSLDADSEPEDSEVAEMAA